MTLSLSPKKFYHLTYSNENDKLFRQEKNYQFFLKKYFHYIQPIAETFAYCLLPNSFEILIKIKEEQEFASFFNFEINGKNSKFHEKFILKYISQQFDNLFTDYQNEYNSIFGEKNLFFDKNIETKNIQTKEYFVNTVKNIHLKPVNNNFAKEIEEWKFTSYNSFFAEGEQQVKIKTIIDYFGSIYKFRDFSSQ